MVDPVDLHAKIAEGEAAHDANVAAIADNSATIATLKKALLGLAVLVVTSLGTAITGWVANGSKNPLADVEIRVRVIEMPAVKNGKAEPVLIDPALLTDDQKKAIATTVIPKDAGKPK